MCIQSAFIQNIYTSIHTYIHGQPHRSQADTQNSHTNTGRTNWLTWFPFLTEQDGGPLIATHVHWRSLHQPGSDTQSAQELTLGFQFRYLVAPDHMNAWDHGPTPVAGTDCHINAHTQPSPRKVSKKVATSGVPALGLDSSGEVVYRHARASSVKGHADE